MSKYTEPGRGRKQCPKCKGYEHVRSAKCECGYEWIKVETEVVHIDKPKGVVAKGPVHIEKKPYIEKEAKEPFKPKFVETILTPAGACPIELTGTSKEVVQEWKEAVKSHYTAKGQEIGESGLMYYVRQFFPMYVKGLKGLSLEYLAVKAAFTA